MIGFINGAVIFSDGKEAIVQTDSGVGYQIYCYYILPEGEKASLLISHIVRENSEELFSFKSLREKKLFELLTTVKGVGPKSAYNIISGLGVEQIISSIATDDKKTLTKISGVGAKAASQMVLDLQKKIIKITMFSDQKVKAENLKFVTNQDSFSISKEVQSLETITPNNDIDAEELLSDTILACKNLGFHTDQIVPLAQKILKENEIKKPEQLVHLVLKEI